MGLMGLKLLQAPTNEPVSVDEIKTQLRIEHDDENDLLKGYIKAAREYCEGLINYKISKQQWTVSYDTFKAEMPLNVAPFISVDSVQYYDENDTFQTLDTSVYQVNDYYVNYSISRKYNQEWPTISPERKNAVLINCTVGSEQPKETHRQAIMLIVGAWYKHREELTDLNLQKIPNGAKH